MNQPTNFERILKGQRYRTATAVLLADDCYWDGSNHERNGRNTFLYRTPNGRYFCVTLTQWQGEQDTLTPLEKDEAIALYEGRLSEQHVDYAAAFPGVSIEEA